MKNKVTFTKNTNAKPFLKWAGGKRRLVPDLFRFVPDEYNDYYEPFLGSGALFFAIRPKMAYLSDMNEELINSYIQIKENIEEVIKFLKGMKYDRKSYYKIRASKCRKKASKAARFIYLNRTCWNGLYRVNPRGEFNVPMGRYKHPTICDEKNLRKVSTALQGPILNTSDFEAAVQNASKDDLIYFDPPYVTSHNNNSFIKYNSKIFSLYDQERLREAVDVLDKRNCKIIISNADCSFIRKLYKGLNINVVIRQSTIAGSNKNRGVVTEFVITNYEINE